MARQTFEWFPDFESELDMKPNVNVTNFGDGYEARVAQGINFKPQKWSLTFNRDATVVDAVLDFLEAAGGVDAFDWTTPRGQQGVYVCREWKDKRLRGGGEVTCTFEQVFEY